MLIDWFTVVAQAINFLILVWLLKRFLYQPILDAIDTREKGIAAKIADAQDKEAEAEQQREIYEKKNEAFDKQRDQYMHTVREEAKAERGKLLDEARQASEDLRRRREQSLKHEQLSLNDEIGRRTREEVFAIARKILADLAGMSLEQRMTEIFVERLSKLSMAQIAELKLAFKSTTDAMQVRTAFALSAQQKKSIETVIKKMLGEQKHVDFIILPGLMSGIELSSDGRKIAWSIADYLDSLAKSVDELLTSKTKNGQAPLTDLKVTAAAGVVDSGH